MLKSVKINPRTKFNCKFAHKLGTNDLVVRASEFNKVMIECLKGQGLIVQNKDHSKVTTVRYSDVNKDFKDKDQTLKAKDQDKD